MPASRINVSPQEIDFAERILLNCGHKFDAERTNFIKNCNTLDLQAVAGSGKTTALLAKLLILDKALPFSDNSGILVISHTNAAIEEIKERISRHSHQITKYPNYIGTIQSFVDQFLAIPYYSIKYKKKCLRIDDEIYRENHFIPQGAHNWLSNRSDSEKIICGSRLINDDTLTYIPSKDIFPLTDKSKPTYQAILRMKQQVREKGLLCFDEAYILAFEYLNHFPHLISLLQRRFSYVFVDEMQDMDATQYEILERIFFDNGRSASIFQRIGDKNQAIYGGGDALESNWEDRPTVLTLKGSFRLTQLNANVAKYFTLYPIEIEGRRTKADGSQITIKPHVLIFTNDSILKVIPKYAELIKKLMESGQISDNPPYVFKAVGWIKKTKSDDKLGICDYYPEFSIEEHIPKIDHPSLESYLPSTTEQTTLATIRKNILNSFLKVLRIENITTRSNQYFTKRKLIHLLREENPTLYNEMNLKIYQWSIGMIRGNNKDDILSEIRAFIPQLLSLFGKCINLSNTFINSNSKAEISASSENRPLKSLNTYKHDNVEIEITTVHSAKGQTHTATLYLETSYQGRYESELLNNCFTCKAHNFQLVKIKMFIKKSLLKLLMWVYQGRLT